MHALTVQQLMATLSPVDGDVGGSGDAHAQPDSIGLCCCMLSAVKSGQRHLEGRKAVSGQPCSMISAACSTSANMSGITEQASAAAGDDG